MGSKAHLQGQLVVEDRGACSSTVNGPAIELQGNATLFVPQLPPVSVGGPSTPLGWSESAY